MVCASGAARHDLAAGNANVYADTMAELGREHGNAAPDFEGGPDASLRVIAMGDWRSEDRHYAIANMFVDGPAVIGDACVGKIEEAPKEGVGLLGVERSRELRVAGEICEKHRHVPPLSLGQR